MVEGQMQAPVPGVDDDRGPRVVGGRRRALSPGDEHRRNGMETRVASGVGVGVELAEELDVERCLLAGLADGRRLERLAVVDEAAGQGPAGRRVLSLDEDDAPPFPAVHHFDDDVDGGDGVSEFLTAHLAAQSVKAIVWARSASVNEGASAVVVVRGDLSGRNPIHLLTLGVFPPSSFATGPGKGTCPKGTAKAL